MGLFKRKGRLSLNSRKRKYSYEIKAKVETRKNGNPYYNKNGEPYPLSNTQLAYRSGFFSALRDVLRHNKSKRKDKNMKTYCFSAFNSNCDVFNVVVKGRNKNDALKFARKHLKKDPRYKGHSVTISSSKGDTDNYFRILSVYRNGKVSDNFST